MKIGLPNALMYGYYYPLWEELFKGLGFETIVSSPTNNKIVEYGVKETVSELCFPVKLFNGHVVDLLKRGADKVFVPQFIRINKSEWLCPKFLGLPSIVKYTVPGIEERMVTSKIEGNREDTCELKNYIDLCRQLNINKKDLKRELIRGQKYFTQYRNLCKRGYTIAEASSILKTGKEVPIKAGGKLKIGVLGYIYNIYDPFIGMNIIQRLRNMDVEILTFEMLNESQIERRNKHKEVFWTFARKIYNAGLEMINMDDIDGILHVTAFSCGPDSVIGKLLEGDAAEKNKPFMTVRVDEHTGEGHIQTRLEAFVDMLIKD